MWNLRRITLSVGLLAGLSGWALAPAQQSSLLRSPPAAARVESTARNVDPSSLAGSDAARMRSREAG